MRSQSLVAIGKSLSLLALISGLFTAHEVFSNELSKTCLPSVPAIASVTDSSVQLSQTFRASRRGLPRRREGGGTRYTA